MKDLFKFGAIGVGVYLLYQQLFGKPAATTTTPATTTTTTPATTTTTTTPATTAAPTTRALLIAAAGNGPLTFHQWQWFYTNKLQPGIVGPAPEDVGMGDGTALISADQYLAAVAPKGLTGSNFRRVW